MHTEPMSQLRTEGLTIAHPTALWPEEESAFAHALALAVRSRSTLHSVHVNDDVASRERIPRAVDWFMRWGALSPGAVEGDEAKLGMRHERRCENCCDDPVDTLLYVLRRVEPDLVVAATRAREGAQRLLFGSVIESLALEVRAPTLLLPMNAGPFVSSQTGALHVARMLVPAGDVGSAEVGARHAAWFADLAGCRRVEVELLYVGDESAAPTLALPTHERVSFVLRFAGGAPETAIVKRAEETSADLIVMPTRGHDSLSDVLRGSHTERVLHHAPCPVLSVPLANANAR